MLYGVLFTSSLLILAVFGLRKLTMGKISMSLRYALWLLVAVRLLVPVSVGTSPVSVMNLLPERVSEHVRLPLLGGANGEKPASGDGQGALSVGERDSVFADGPAAETAKPEGQESGKDEAAAPEGVPQGRTVPEREAVAGQDGSLPADVSLSGIFGVVWLLGTLAVGGYMALSKWRFIRFLHRNRRALPDGAVPEEFAGRLARRGMKVYQVKGLPGPCLAGRHIYIGEGMAAQEQQLVHILAHEYCHALHGDGFWAFLRCLLSAVYWFDPFVWAAAYAARQDSELACDEAAVWMLGEPCRFAYGRTLLALLEDAGGGERCSGMSFMTDGGEGGIRERILALTQAERRRGTVLAAVLVAAALACGCAFTGAEQRAQEEPADGTEDVGGTRTDVPETENVLEMQDRQMIAETANEEFDRMQKEYEAALKELALSREQVSELEEKYVEAVKEAELSERQIEELEERLLQEAVFEETLYAYDDDGGLSLNREVDYQTYYDFTLGKAANPMGEGWYRICENEDAGITLYGLYTEDFGFRGLKMRIGEDVNTYDIQWYPALANSDKDNILVLERADDGMPRRFVWKLPVVDSSTEEIWRLYGGYRYDTGTVELKTLSEEECFAWAKAHLHFDVDQEAEKVYVVCEGDMVLGDMDISAYAAWKPAYAQIVPDVLGVTFYEGGDDAAGEEGVAVQLAAGLKLEGVDGLWFDGLPLLTVQVAADENSDSGFRLQSPRIAENHATAPWQKKALEELE